MIFDTLNKLFERDLTKLQQELLAYKNEKIIWEVASDISNSAGNLCLHLVGNLNTFIGTELGKTGYVRQRGLEFSQKNIPKDKLIAMVEETKSTIKQTLEKLTSEDLKLDYPIEVFGGKMSTMLMLVHLTTHLTYHLGQINYHRRLLDV